jgi:small subunit ribosomal protein S4e
MSKHLKRQCVPKSWPIERKGSKYVVKPRANIKNGIPVLIILRDILKLAQNRNEAKKIIHSKQILINEKPAKDEKNNVLLFDTLSIIPLKEYYRLELTEKGKFCLNKIKENETNKKISKIINKKILKGKKIQLNLSDGRNFLSDIKCNINDSVVINLKEKKIEKCLPLKEKAKVIIFAGKYAGKKGEIEKLNLEEKSAKVKISEKEINVLINQLMVIE